MKQKHVWEWLKELAAGSIFIFFAGFMVFTFYQIVRYGMVTYHEPVAWIRWTEMIVVSVIAAFALERFTRDLRSMFIELGKSVVKKIKSE